jgi:2-oxoglutarate ferredoxin oxidoreductase subunit delta
MSVKVAVLKERCKGCGICVQICQTRVLEMSEEENSLGCKLPEVKNIEACLVCGLCEMLCPDFAIWVFDEQDEAEA